MNRFRLLLIGLLAVTSAACSSGDDTTVDPDRSPVATGSGPDDAASESGIDPDDDAPVDVDEATPDTDPPSVTTAPVTSPPPPTTAPSIATELDVTSVSLLTAPEGGGDKPLLEWEPTEGASEYRLVVTNTDGIGYWTWSGSESSIWFGGSIEQPAPDTGGAVLLESMLWQVFAIDAAGELVGVSELTPIAP